MWKLGVCKSAWWQHLHAHEVERSRWVFGLGLPVSSMLFLFSLVNFWCLCCLYAVELVMSESERLVSLSFCRFLCDCEWNRHRGNHSSTSHTWFKPNNWDVCSFLVSAFTHWLTLANHGKWNMFLFMYRYWLPAGSSDSLTVHVLLNSELSEALWQQSGVLSSSWEVAEVSVSSYTEFKVSGVNNTQIQLDSLTVSH